MKNNLVLYSVEDGIALLRLHRPPANLYDHEMMRELDEAILESRFDDNVHLLLLCGSGERFFCGGADLRMLERATPELKYQFRLHAGETLERLTRTPKLVIAGLNGHTVGGGLEIALAADLRIGRRGGGKIGLPEVKLGILPGTGGTQRLARLLGSARALELMVSGRLMEFEEAAEIGLVERLLGPGDFEAELRAYASRFVPPAGAGKAIGSIKRAVQSGLQIPLGEALSLERELQQQLFASEDAAEGLRAFLDKRVPEFKGR